ncbi:MAG: hypothetical protein FWD34_06430 [Oscillospiraceae bacterium]|nr:hypothetical protein [Oscillospiraceae bacterium]
MNNNMKRPVGSFLFMFTALLLGVMIYVLFRPPLSWFPIIGNLDNAIIDLSQLPIFLSDFIKYHLSDILWALALAETVYIIKNNIYFAFFTALILTILFEIMQYIGIVSGTGDVLDVVFVACSLSIYFIIKKRKHRHEKEI